MFAKGSRIYAVAALFCFVTVGAETERVVANLFVTDSPAYPGPTTTVAGQPFVNNFILTDFETNATIAEELGFCVPVRDPGPAECTYTLTIRNRHTSGETNRLPGSTRLVSQRLNSAFKTDRNFLIICGRYQA